MLMTLCTTFLALGLLLVADGRKSCTPEDDSGLFTFHSVWLPTLQVIADFAAPRLESPSIHNLGEQGPNSARLLICWPVR